MAPGVVSTVIARVFIIVNLPWVLSFCSSPQEPEYNQNMTTAKINRAIRHLGLEIVHERGSGYSYFLDTTTGDQIGESVQVCYLHHLSLHQWVEEAKHARNPSIIRV